LDDRCGPRLEGELGESFRDGTLIPAMQAGIEGGFAAPLAERAFEVHNQQ